MSRQKRLYFNNAIYHITIRGNNKQAILRTEEDKKSFLNTLNKFKARFKFKLYAFVLMDNHAHLVIGTNNHINISKIMQAITLSYSQKFRRKYNYTGYVWQGRFKSNIIEGDKYILECVNYIHNNPVRANMVNDIRNYTFSSYHFYHGIDSSIKEDIQIDRFDLS